MKTPLKNIVPILLPLSEDASLLVELPHDFGFLSLLGVLGYLLTTSLDVTGH